MNSIVLKYIINSMLVLSPKLVSDEISHKEEK